MSGQVFMDDIVRAEELHARVLAVIDRVAMPGLRSIAERHVPVEYSYYVRCEEAGDELSSWPCPDFRDLAAAVGVEVGE